MNGSGGSSDGKVRHGEVRGGELIAVDLSCTDFSPPDFVGVLDELELKVFHEHYPVRTLHIDLKWRRRWSEDDSLVISNGNHD